MKNKLSFLELYKLVEEDNRLLDQFLLLVFLINLKVNNEWYIINLKVISGPYIFTSLQKISAFILGLEKLSGTVKEQSTTNAEEVFRASRAELIDVYKSISPENSIDGILEELCQTFKLTEYQKNCLHTLLAFNQFRDEEEFKSIKERIIKDMKDKKAEIKGEEILLNSDLLYFVNLYT